MLNLNSRKRRLFVFSSLMALGNYATAVVAQEGYATGDANYVAALLPAFIGFLTGQANEVSGGDVAASLEESGKISEALENHDLSRTVGKTIGALLERCVADYPQATDTLTAISRFAKTHWVEWAVRQDVLFDGLQSTKLVQYFNTPAEKFYELVALTPAQWVLLLQFLEAEAQAFGLQASLREEIAERLHREFPQALRDMLKQDCEDHGRAFAAMVFMLLSEILHHSWTIEQRQSAHYEVLFSKSNTIILQLQKLTEAQRALPTTVGVSEKFVKEALELAQERQQQLLLDITQQLQQLAASVQAARSDIGITYDAVSEVLTVVQALQAPRPLTTVGDRDTLPSKPSLYFTGHEQEYNTLVETLAVGDAALTQPAALKGMGGVGKTQLALKFATEHKALFPNGIFWIPAETADGALQKLLEYADRFAPEVVVEQKPELTALRFCDWLAAQGKFLAIFDNADDFDPTKHYAEALGKSGRLLYTTRARHLPSYVEDISVKTLSKALGGQLLLKCMQFPFPSEERASGRGVRGEVNAALLTEAEALSERLGGLPLAIDQAGAYLRETGYSISWYAEQYEARGNELRQMYGESEQSREHASVAVTFSLALERLKEKSPASADLMRVLAFLAPDNIPESMFATGAEYLGKRLGPLATNTIAWSKVVGYARQLSLLDRSKPPGYLSLHRVVQDVVKDTLSEKQRSIYVTAAIGIVASVTPNIDNIAWWKPQDIFAQWPTVIEEAIKISLKTTELSYILNEFCLLRQYLGIFQKTEYYLRLSISIIEHNNGKDSQEIIPILVRLAYFMHIKIENREKNIEYLKIEIRYKELEKIYQRALHISQKISTENNSNIASILDKFGYFLQTQNRFHEACIYLVRALELRKNQSNEFPLDFAQSLNGLAYFIYTTKRNNTFHEIEELIPIHYRNEYYLYKTSIHFYKCFSKNDNLSLATVLLNSARFHEQNNNYSKANEEYHESLSIRKSILGLNHLNVAEVFIAIGTFFIKIHHYSDAEQYLQQAFKTRLYLLENKSDNIKYVAKEWIDCLRLIQKNQGSLISEVPQKLYEQALMIVNQNTE